MKKEEFKIKEKDTDNLFEDLNFQINSIFLNKMSNIEKRNKLQF